jgi:hypothetical protein
MSTWISKAVLFALLLSGCVAPDGTAGLLPKAGANAPEQRQALTVSGVKLAGPQGFCLLPGTRQRVSGADFVAFGSCDGASGPILTATVGAQGSAAGLVLNVATMAPYFKSENGLAALRGPGNQDRIAVRGVSDYQGAVLLRLTRETAAGKSEQWRALTRVGGRLVTLTVRPRPGQTLATAEGRRRARQFLDALRGANGL